MEGVAVCRRDSTRNPGKNITPDKVRREGAVIVTSLHYVGCILEIVNKLRTT